MAAERKRELLDRLMEVQAEVLQLTIQLHLEETVERRGPQPAQSADGRARPALVKAAG